MPRKSRSDQAEGEKMIRVCNFCLKQREEASTGAGRNGMLSPCLSSVSMESSKTSSTGQTLSTVTGGSAASGSNNDQNYDCAAGEYVRYGQAIAADACPEMEEFFEPEKAENDTDTVCEHYECSLNRYA